MVIGTGHRSGKTTLAAALIRRLNVLELPAVGIKPIEVGCRYGEDHDLIGVDGARLREAARVQIPPLVASPYRFAAEPPPALTAEQAGLELTLADLVSAVDAAKTAGLGSVVVEGPGGPLTPLVADGTTLDLAQRLDADVFLVGPSRPGVDSSLLLALEAAGRRAVRVKGVLLTHLHADLQAHGVPEVLKRWGPAESPIVYPAIPHDADPISRAETHLAEHRLAELLVESASAA